MIFRSRKLEGLSFDNDNKKHVQHILGAFDLGELASEPTAIEGSRGGAFIWKITTPLQSYAIKQISPDLNLTDADIIDKYERSESIAFEFSNHGMPSVAALKKGSKHLVVIEDKVI
jgi:hypothetical protein